jgi:hypothetical protein
MEDRDLKNIWQSYDKKIAEAIALNAQSWALNLSCFATIQQQKAASKTNALAKFKTRAIVLGIIWVLFLLFFVWGNQLQNLYFAVSLTALALFSAYAIIVYIKHIILIRQLEYDGNIIETQKKLAELQASTFKSTRILWLQMPFYTTWFWHSSWIHFDSPYFWLITFPITMFFTLLAVYLYKNIHAGNMHKKWVRSLMMAGPEYKNVMKSIKFLEEIEEFNKETT